MKKTEKDFEQLASSIVELVGGKDNIAHAGHCMTRLRVTPKDVGQVRLDEIKKLDVAGAQMIGDQVQIIIGKDIEDVYDAFVKITGVERTAAIDENLDTDLVPKKKSAKEILGSILPTIVACVFPILPALIACGMMQAFIMILVNLHVLAADSPTVATFTWVSNVAFYFLPVLVGAAAAKKFNVKMAMGILMGCILLAPEFVELCSAGMGATIPNPGGPPTVIPGTGNAGFLFGMPIYPATYSNTILPVILCVWILGYLEKFFNKIFPKSVRIVLTPLFEMLVMVPLGLLVIAPLGARLSVLLIGILIFLFRTLGPFAPVILTVLMPFIVLTGMHFNLMAVAMALASVAQKNIVTHPALFLMNFTQGAACLAVALKTKNAERKALGFSSAFSDMVPGISEPGLYGITLKYKTPMIAAMIGSGIAAFIGGLLNLGSYSGGPPNLFTLALFINPANGDMTDLRNAILCIIIGVVITFVLTFVLYKDEKADQLDAKG